MNLDRNMSHKLKRMYGTSLIKETAKNLGIDPNIVDDVMMSYSLNCISDMVLHNRSLKFPGFNGFIRIFPRILTIEDENILNLSTMWEIPEITSRSIYTRKDPLQYIYKFRLTEGVKNVLSTLSKTDPSIISKYWNSANKAKAKKIETCKQKK